MSEPIEERSPCADYAPPDGDEKASVMGHTQYEQRVAVEVRAHAASLMECWVEEGRDDTRIENLVRSLVLHAYVSGRDQGQADARNEPRMHLPARKEAELDAVITAVTTNGYGRLMEMIPTEDHAEALACIKGMVRAVVAAQFES